MITEKMPDFFHRRLMLLLIVSVLFFLPANGQGGYKKGHIIVNDTTIMAGSILPVSSDGIITACLFCVESGSVPVSYSPDDIQAYSFIKGRQFISGKLKSAETSGLFLEVLFDGAADLYYYGNGNTDHYLISGINGRIFKLNVSKPEKRSSSGADQEDIMAIRSVLRIVMADAPALTDRINMLEPDREVLIDLMHDYHVLMNQSESNIFYELPPPALELSGGVFFRYGIDLFNADETGDQAGYSFDPALYPGIGICLTTSFPRITRNFRSTLNLSLAERYLYGLKTEEIPNYSLTLYEEMHMHHLILSGELLFEYAFGTGRFQPSIFAGPVFQYVINDESRIDYDMVGEDLIISESIPFESESQFHGGVMVAAGVSYAMNSSWTLFLRTGYSRLSGDDSFSGLNAFNVVAGITF